MSAPLATVVRAAALACAAALAAIGLPAAAAQPSTPAAASRPAAGVDANVATTDELQTVRGIGPALAGRIIEERARGPYRDLADLEARVKGVGPGNVRRFAEAGLVVVAGRGRLGPSPAAGSAPAGPGGGGSAAALPPAGGQTMTTTPLGSGVVREYHRPAEPGAPR
jgi:competence protein ComEA